MAADREPLALYKFTGEVLVRSIEHAEITARKRVQGGFTAVTLDVRFLDEGSEIPVDLPTMYVAAHSVATWQTVLRNLEDARPGLDWVDMLETFRAWAAPTLPPLTRLEYKRKLLTLEDLRNLPDTTWAIDGIIPAGVLAILFGPSGVGKSFVALDMALCTAARARWMGRDVAQGSVLYIAAEGRRGIPKRVEAWHVSRTDCDASSIRFLDEPVNMLDEREVDSLLADIAEMDTPPTLVVVDTLARCFGPFDENSTRDMGVFVAGCDRVRRATGATVLVVHHTGWNGDRERGNSALRAGADTMIAVTADDNVMKLACVKQKDAEEFTPIYGVRTQAADSCFIAPMSMSVDGQITGKARQILAELTDTFTDTGATPTQLVNATNITERTVLRSLNSLVSCGLAHRKGSGNRVRYYKGPGND